MRFKLMTRRNCVSFVLGLTLFNRPAIAAQSSNEPISGWTMESILRAKALHTPRPVYPGDAVLARTTGVAVVNIWLNDAGLVSRYEVLQAPCESIADSVGQAVSQWRFQLFLDSHGRPMLASGKLTFYFQIRNAIGVVLDPADTGYVGHWPEHRSASLEKSRSSTNSIAQVGASSVRAR